MVIAVDYDGVLHNTHHPIPGRKLGPPMEGAKEAMQGLKAAGHTLIVHSCAPARVIADWMAYWQIPYSTIWQGVGKPKADCYVDDRALHHTSWEDTLRQLPLYERGR